MSLPIVQLAHLVIAVREVEKFCAVKLPPVEAADGGGRVGRPRGAIAQTYARSMVARRLRLKHGYPKPSIAVALGTTCRSVRRWTRDL